MSRAMERDPLAAVVYTSLVRPRLIAGAPAPLVVVNLGVSVLILLTLRFSLSSLVGGALALGALHAVAVLLASIDPDLLEVLRRYLAEPQRFYQAHGAPGGIEQGPRLHPKNSSNGRLG